MVIKIFDWWGIWTGKDFRKPWPPQPGWEDWTIVWHNLEHIWHKYNTDDFQPSVWSANRDAILAHQGWADRNAGEDVPEEESQLKMPDTLEEFLDMYVAERPSGNLRGLIDYVKTEYESKMTLAALSQMMMARGCVFPNPGDFTFVKEE